MGDRIDPTPHITAMALALHVTIRAIIYSRLTIRGYTVNENEKFTKKTRNYVMEKDSDETLEKHEQIRRRDEGGEKEHTLQENARERTKRPYELNSGTPYDWEDLAEYTEELERMDREGPGDPKNKDD